MNGRKVAKALALATLAGAVGYGIVDVKDRAIKAFDEARMGVNFVKDGSYKGYATTIGVDGLGRGVSLTDGEARLSAKDFQNDGRFEEIYLKDIPKGHALENLASVTELEKAYETVNNQK